MWGWKIYGSKRDAIAHRGVLFKEKWVKKIQLG